MPSPFNPPDSPPARPVVPKGLATHLGMAGAMLLYLASALTPLLDGAGAGTSKTFATLGTVVLVATILGRMLQAAAAYLASGMNPPMYSPAPSEEILKSEFPEDSPEDPPVRA